MKLTEKEQNKPINILKHCVSNKTMFPHYNANNENKLTAVARTQGLGAKFGRDKKTDIQTR